MVIQQYGFIKIQSDARETDAVKLALANLKRDFRRVLDVRINEQANVPMVQVIVGTVGISDAVMQKADTGLLKDGNGNYRKEAYLIQEKDGELLIAGTDRRGTVYGIYSFCEWMGVSPWHFFADVPVRKKTKLEIADGFVKTDYPSVGYRGIFINDEEELEHWAQRFMGEETIGVKTYEHIFELLLRLRLNYIWPAMHVNSFNAVKENGALADRMGIVVGTSHCDMLMRSNNREWKPWIARKGYTGAEYDYSIPGRNREILDEYWRESIEQNKDFEVSYTLGMRGIHDSGFETKSLEGKTGKELLDAKTELLDTVITAQEQLLRETLGTQKEVLKTFVPYKEVLELYDNGLNVPEDLTLIWVNDNYGYVRRYPDELEKKRSGGNGIYYHNSYWAPPGGSYLFICSIPMAQTGNELMKAYNEGIRKLWVTNFGAMKPLEQQISYYAMLAWEAGRENAVASDGQAFLTQWIDRTFSHHMGAELAPMLLEFDQLTNVRKLEQMDIDAFSQTAYGDEAAERVNRYKEMFELVNRLWKALPRQEQDAFFQLVAMKVHAAYYTNCMYYYADRSNLCVAQGKDRAAAKYTRLSFEYDTLRRKMLYYYNHVMANGKWNGILTPEDYPPPRTAMYPACMPPLRIGSREMIVTLWNDEQDFGKGLAFVRKDHAKWIEIANAGEGSFAYEVEAPEWLDIENPAGAVTDEVRLIVSVKHDLTVNIIKKDVITIKNVTDHQSVQVAVTYAPTDPAAYSGIEEDGRICIEATSYIEGTAAAINAANGWRAVPNLGRARGALLEAGSPPNGEKLIYTFVLTTAGEHLFELHRFPSLNATGRIRAELSVDGGSPLLLESGSGDEHCGNWKENVRNNVDKLYLTLPYLEAGTHSISICAEDKYFSFSRFVIYTAPRKENSLGTPCTGNQRLPQPPVADTAFGGMARQLYGETDLPPRPAIFLPIRTVGDTLTMEDIVVAREQAEEKTTPQEILGSGKTIFPEQSGGVKIDAASALVQSEYAYAVNTDDDTWSYCSSPSYDNTGLAMYLRKMRPVLKESGTLASLHYRIRVNGGRYRIWILAHMWGMDTSHFTIGIDGRMIPEKELYNGKGIWRYSLEQVWAWLPVYEITLDAGEHLFSIYSLSAHLRFDRIHITADMRWGTGILNQKGSNKT